MAFERLFENRSLNQLNLLGVLFSALFILLFTAFLLYGEYREYRTEVAATEANYLASQKALVKSDTERALRYIAYKYRTDRGKPLPQLQREIVDAIEQMRNDRDGSGYVFIYTFDGINIADPILKHNAGKNLLDFTDPNGKKVIKELIDISRRSEGGYVAYVWNKPIVNRLVPKISYARSFEPFGWMVGSGVYLDDVEKRLAQMRTEYQHKVVDTVVKVFILIGAILAILSLFSGILSHVIKRDFDRLIAFFEHAQEGEATLDEQEVRLVEFRRISGFANAMSRTIDTQRRELREANEELEERVRQKTAKLQMAFEAQDKFVKHAIHEINTPLAIIQTNIDLLELQGAKEAHLAKIEAASRIISTIYADLGYFIKKDRFVRKKELLNFSDFLIARIDYFAEVFAQNNLGFEIAIVPGLFVNFDPVQLGRVVDNTLSNALKYARPETDVTVSLARAGDKVRLSVGNVCYAAFDSDKVFDRYYRQDDAKGGFGLGLAMVAQICNENAVAFAASCERETAIFSYDFDDACDTLIM